MSAHPRRPILAGLAVAAAVLVTAAACGSPGISGTAQRGETPMTVSSPTQPETTPEQPTSAPAVSTSIDQQPSPTETTPSAPPSTTSTSASCDGESTWTTDDESEDLNLNSPIIGVTGESADCADVITIKLRAPAQPPGYQIGYVDHVISPGSGHNVEVAGDAKMQVVIDSPAYDPETGEQTLAPADREHLVDVSGFPAIRQVVFAATFEGQTTLGIGVADHRPFHVDAGVNDDGTGYVRIEIAHE